MANISNQVTYADVQATKARHTCKRITCFKPCDPFADFCEDCTNAYIYTLQENPMKQSVYTQAEKYPAYFKSVQGFESIDVYAVHHLFGLDDPAGILHHASKKLLLSGVRTGGKSKYDDIREARDSLNRWLLLNQPS